MTTRAADDFEAIGNRMRALAKGCSCHKALHADGTATIVYVDPQCALHGNPDAPPPAPEGGYC